MKKKGNKQKIGANQNEKMNAKWEREKNISENIESNLKHDGNNNSTKKRRKQQKNRHIR